MLRCLRSALPSTPLGFPFRRLKLQSSNRAFTESAAAMETHSPSTSILRDPAYPRFRAQCLGRYSLSAANLDGVVGLLEAGSTVPFIVRYRSHVIGAMDAEGAPLTCFAVSAFGNETAIR